MTIEMPSQAKNGDGSAGPSMQRRRILVVDEDAPSACCLARLLAAGGHAVEVAHDAATAVEKVREHRPECFIVDVGLSGTSGCRLAERLRADGYTEAALFIAVSGHPAHGGCPKFHHHLVKPLDFESLSDLIARDS